MKPILFDDTATTFTTNGLGRLDCVSCIVTEERNGQYILEMFIAESALHADEIAMNSIICVIPSDGATLQAFRVYKITKPINGIFGVYAEHISYQLSLIPTMPFTIAASNHACQDTLNALKSNAVVNCPFTFSTDVTTIAGYSQELPASIRSRLGGVTGSVLDQFGGEYQFDNYAVYLKDHRGTTTPQYTLLYGKNITDLSQEENIANTITGIVPYWTDGTNTVTLPEKVIETSNATSFPFKCIVPYDFSSSFENQPSEAQLRAKAQAYVNQSGVGTPVVSIKVSFVQLSDTEEYKDIMPLQHVKLCDVINVRFAKYDIDVTAKIVKTVYDVLAERYNEIEVGSIRSSLATTITDAQNATDQKFANFSNEIGQMVDGATAWLTSSNGYVMAVKNAAGEWSELIFADHDDPADWVHVLRINENGIGFSSDGGTTYTQAWTLDGKLVIGGTDVPSLTVYDNQTPPNIIFQTSQSGTIWNSTNSSMDATGILTAVGAILQGTLYCGSSNTGQSAVDISGGAIKFSYETDSTGQIKAEYDITHNRSELSLNSGAIAISASNGNVVMVDGGGTIGGVSIVSGVTLSGNEQIYIIQDDNTNDWFKIEMYNGEMIIEANTQAGLSYPPRIKMTSSDITFYDGHGHSFTAQQVYNIL